VYTLKGYQKVYIDAGTKIILVMEMAGRKVRAIVAGSEEWEAYRRRVAEQLRANGTKVCKRCGIRLGKDGKLYGFGVKHEHEFADPLEVLETAPWLIVW